MRSPTVLIALLGLVACSDLSPKDELSAARQRWEAWGPASYDLTIYRSCECLFPDMTGPVVVRVVNGTVQSKTYVTTGQPANIDDPRFPTVEGLFDIISESVARGDELTEVDYDPVTGLPREIRIDMSASVADDEYSYTATLAPISDQGTTFGLRSQRWNQLLR